MGGGGGDGGSSPALVSLSMSQCTLGIRDWGTLSWDAQAPPLRPFTVVDSHSNPKRRSRMSRVDHRAGFGSGVRARAAHGPLDWEKCGLELSVRAGAPGGCGPVRLTDEGVPLGWQDVEHWTSRGAPPTVVYNHVGEPKMRTQDRVHGGRLHGRPRPRDRGHHTTPQSRGMLTSIVSWSWCRAGSVKVRRTRAHLENSLSERVAGSRKRSGV